MAVVVKLTDALENTLHIVKGTKVEGERETGPNGKDIFRVLKEGDNVAVQYPALGTDETAEEIYLLGKAGLKAAEVTLIDIDLSAKTLKVNPVDGAEETYRLAHIAADEAKRIVEGWQTSRKVTVYYYTDKVGTKVTLFLVRAID